MNKQFVLIFLVASHLVSLLGSQFVNRCMRSEKLKCRFFIKKRQFSFLLKYEIYFTYPVFPRPSPGLSNGFFLSFEKSYGIYPRFQADLPGKFVISLFLMYIWFEISKCGLCGSLDDN